MITLQYISFTGAAGVCDLYQVLWFCKGSEKALGSTGAAGYPCFIVLLTGSSATWWIVILLVLPSVAYPTVSYLRQNNPSHIRHTYPGSKEGNAIPLSERGISNSKVPLSQVVRLCFNSTWLFTVRENEAFFLPLKDDNTCHEGLRCQEAGTSSKFFSKTLQPPWTQAINTENRKFDWEKKVPKFLPHLVFPDISSQKADPISSMGWGDLGSIFGLPVFRRDSLWVLQCGAMLQWAPQVSRENSWSYFLPWLLLWLCTHFNTQTAPRNQQQSIQQRVCTSIRIPPAKALPPWWGMLWGESHALPRAHNGRPPTDELLETNQRKHPSLTVLTVSWDSVLCLPNTGGDGVI